MHVKKIVFGVSCLIMSTTLMPAANAGTATGKLTIRATIAESCKLTSDNSLIDFGTLTQFVKPNTAQTDNNHGIKVLCSKDRAYSLNLDGGQNTSNPTLWTGRRMKSGNNYIFYSLYKDANRSSEWGMGNGIASYNSKGTGTEQVFPVYASTFASKTIPPVGEYSDIVTIELKY